MAVTSFSYSLAVCVCVCFCHLHKNTNSESLLKWNAYLTWCKGEILSYQERKLPLVNLFKRMQNQRKNNPRWRCKIKMNVKHKKSKENLKHENKTNSRRKKTFYFSWKTAHTHHHHCQQQWQREDRKNLSDVLSGWDLFLQGFSVPSKKKIINNGKSTKRWVGEKKKQKNKNLSEFLFFYVWKCIHPTSPPQSVWRSMAQKKTWSKSGFCMSWVDGMSIIITAITNSNDNVIGWTYFPIHGENLTFV